jgi:DNA-binding transcriptional MocR family regulator
MSVTINQAKAPFLAEILTKILNRAKGGKFTLPIRKTATEMGVSHVRISTALKQLQDKGLIRKGRANGKGSPAVHTLLVNSSLVNSCLVNSDGVPPANNKSPILTRDASHPPSLVNRLYVGTYNKGLVDFLTSQIRIWRGINLKEAV